MGACGSCYYMLLIRLVRLVHAVIEAGREAVAMMESIKGGEVKSCQQLLERVTVTYWHIRLTKDYSFSGIELSSA